MRRTFLALLAMVGAAGLFACGDEEENPERRCGEAYAREASRMTDSCNLVYSFSGVNVLLRGAPADRPWVLSGEMDGEPFTCAYTPGMSEEESCSDDPRIRWTPAAIAISAHPCELALRLDVEGETVASATFPVEYEWTSRGNGCGADGVGTVHFGPDAD